MVCVKTSGTVLSTNHGNYIYSQKAYRIMHLPKQTILFFTISLLLISAAANAALTTTATITVKDPMALILVNDLPMACSASCPADCFYGFSACALDGDYTAQINYTHAGTNCDDSFLEPPYSELSPETVLYYCDLTAPTITDNYAYDGIWANTDQTVTLTPIDDASGIKEVKYCEGVNCTPDIVLASPYELDYTTDQNTTVRYQAWDNATAPGTPNPSLIGEYNVLLDKGAPITTCSDCALENPTVAGENTTFSPTCADGGSGCKNTTICADAACTVEYCNFDFGESDCSITTVECTADLDRPFWYYSCDNAHNCETIKGPSLYDIKKANGCSCTSPLECITNCVGGICWNMMPPSIDVSLEDATMYFGKTSRVIVTIKNKNPTSIEVPLYIGGFDDLKNWVWFTGHRTDEFRRSLISIVAPYETKAVSIDILGAKAGSYQIYVGPSTDYSEKYADMEIKIVHKSSGIFSTTPGLSGFSFIFLLVISLTIAMRGNKKV